MALGSQIWYNSATAQRQLPVAWTNLAWRSDMGIIPSPRFYVYILCRPNGKPFYVGKGSGRRIYDHDNEARSGHRCHKCNIIRKIWQQGGEVQRYTVFTTDDQDEAYAYEREMVAMFGRENLANGTDGGMGGMGHKATPEERARRSAFRKAMWNDPEYRARMTAMSQALGASPDFRARLSALNKERLASADERAKMSEAQRRRYEDPAEHAKQSEVNHKRWADPEQRARLAERNKTPEMREKLRQTRLRQWQDPEYRAKMIAARQRRKNKP